MVSLQASHMMLIHDLCTMITSFRQVTKQVLRGLHSSLSSKDLRSSVQNWSEIAKTKTWEWPDSYTNPTVQHVQSLLSSIAKQEPRKAPNILDCHFAFNTQTNETLGSDGYDNYQAPLGPNGEELFARRMWVNGSIEYIGHPILLRERLNCVESISSVRYLSSNVFVKILRVFSKIDVPILPFMRETRTLMYTNNAYSSHSSRKVFPRGVIARSSASVSLDQQANFNLLTSNLHKIHYDLEHCKKEGLPQVLVSGPLLVLLMLHYFSYHFPKAAIKALTYRNSGACFIDDVFDMVITKVTEGYKVYFTRDNHILCEGIFTV